MPRGEETQEVPQEGREETNEVQEQEAQRDQEVVEAPQAVVERERPVAESEAIEREVVEAVEAADLASGETGSEISATPIPLPGQPDRPGDEISATPIPLPGQPDRPGDEISATPRTGDGEGASEAAADGGRETEDREEGVPSSEEVSATPINTPGGGDEISATPINTPGGAGGVSATPINLPRVADDPDHGPSPFTDTAQADQADLSPDDVKLDEGSLDTGEREKTPTQPVIEKELPEDGQMEDGLDQREDIQDMMDNDLDSLLPDGGEIIGADGKKVGGSKFGDELGNLPGMYSEGKIDSSPEDPSGDQFPGKGMFKPGKGPGGSTTASDVPGANPSSTWTQEEQQAYVDVKSGVPEKDIAAKEKALQEKAVDKALFDHKIAYGKIPDPPKPNKSTEESTPEGESGGSDVKRVTQAELDAVIDEVDGSLISNQDPDDQSGEVPDRLTAEGAKKVKDAMDMAASSKGKQKKAGSEVVTDPDSEDQEDKGGGGRLGKKLGL